MKHTIGLFAGTFDPISNGHLDLIERSSRLFNQVIVLVAINSQKKTLFDTKERFELVKTTVDHLDNVTVDLLQDGLVADYAREHGVTANIRGLRNAVDFDYEFTIASVNKKQNTGLETVILYAADEYRYLSSSIIREIAYYQGDISTMVPSHVEKALIKKMRQNHE